MTDEQTEKKKRLEEEIKRVQKIQERQVSEKTPESAKEKRKVTVRPASKTTAAARRVERALDGLTSAEAVVVLRFCLDAAAVVNQQEAYARMEAEAAERPKGIQRMVRVGPPQAAFPPESNAQPQ